MITLQRLNMDSSWHISINNSRFIIDPWLIGSEIDGFKWLNEQWHNTDPVKQEDIPDHDFILVTQPYDDHCHIRTLRALSPSKPILTTRKAFRKVNKAFPEREVIKLANGDNWSGLEFHIFEAPRMTDPVYSSVAICYGERAVFYAPHGHRLTSEQQAVFKGRQVELLITTFTDFKLPAIMGGRVNPGLESAMSLCDQLQPSAIVHTHDEEKTMRGLVSRMARIQYPDFERLIEEDRINFVYIGDYSPTEIAG